jgi:hypothetical protein
VKFSAQLIQEIRQVQAQFKAPDLSSRSAMLGNLTFLYHVMKGSENLLKIAVQCSIDDAFLHTYFIEHLEEERGHEAWLADDLASAGIDVRTSVIPRLAVEAVGSQYYLIQHVDPACLLGYMSTLECFPISLDAISELEKLHGTEVLRTIRYHALHDIDHGSDLLKIIDLLPPERQWIVRQSAVQSALYFAEAMSALS